MRVIDGYNACVLAERLLLVRCRVIARCDVAAAVVVDVVKERQRNVVRGMSKVRSQIHAGKEMKE